MRALVLGSTGMLGLGVCKSLSEHGVEVDGTFQKDKFNLVQKVDLNEAITYDATKSLNSDLLGSSPLSNKYANSKKEDFSASCSIG